MKYHTCLAYVLQAITDHPLSDEKIRVSVLGGGAWGSSLALHCGRKGHEVMVWAREPEVVESINNEHENTVFFKVKVCKQYITTDTRNM